MLRNYLLTAWAVYTRRKLFTAINLLCITLTLVVLLVITALLQNTFWPGGVEGRSDRFLQVTTMTWTTDDGFGRRSSPLGYRFIDTHLRPMQSVSMVSAVTQPSAVSVYQPGKVTELQMRRADAEYWKILDFDVLAGRVPNAEDVEQGRFVAVINESTAGKLFGGTDNALHEKMDVGGQVFEVIGVVADVLHLNAFADIWAPLTTFPSTSWREQMSGSFTALLLAESADDFPRIREELQQIASRVQADDPARWVKAHVWADSKLDVFARLLLDTNRQPDSGSGLLLTIFGVLMLLFMMLPALNLVNLNTGRILERSTEIGVRKAFGASSNQLVLQLVIENVLLCLAGGVLGALAAKGALLWLEGSGLIPYLDADINLPVLACGLLMTLVFGVMSGVVPAWKTSRLDPVHALKGTV